ncbi:MAG: CRTAC1 family protein, partial [Myxococcota bacterium]
VADDGALDVLLATASGVEVRWGPEAWTAEAVPLAHLDLSLATGTVVADVDGDDDLDVYVMRFTGFPAPLGPGDQGKNRLLRNDGDRGFTDVTDPTGVDGCGPHHRDGRDACYRTTTASFGDVDADGDLDLFVGNYGFVDDTPGVRQVDMDPGEPSFVYRQQDDGTFTRETLPDAASDGYTFAGGLLDLDADGDLDLYLVNDFGVRWPNAVLWNDDGEWRLDDGSSGLVQSMTGMGLGVGDLNGDGWPDLAIPNWQDHALFESRAEDERWVETAAARRLVNAPRRNQRVGWGTLLGDLDNDADLDAITQFGFVRNDNPVWANPERQGDAVYLNDGETDFTFTDVARDWGLAEPGIGRGAALADLNRDGWLDLVKRELDGTTRFALSRCGARRGGLLVRLRQSGPNPRAVGARILAKVGRRTVSADVAAGGRGLSSAEPLERHLGLGERAEVRKLTVIWPDGATSEVRGLPTNHAVTLTRDR